MGIIALQHDSWYNHDHVLLYQFLLSEALMQRSPYLVAICILAIFCSLAGKPR